MSFQHYLDEKKELQDRLLEFIDHDGIDENAYQRLINVINRQQIREIRLALAAFLQLLNVISTNHHRTPDLFTKIEKILSELKNEIKENFTNLELFHIFKPNKRVLLFFIQNELFTIDQPIADILLKPKYYKLKYPHYFYPEINSFILDEKLRKEIEAEVNKCSDDFEENRKIGENHTDVCTIIRNDSLDEFKSYAAQNKTSSNTEISIFETNPLLNRGKVTFLDYSAFFGSIEIFNFLKATSPISSETWVYAIHGNNIDIIKAIEEHKTRPKDPSFASLLKETFRCQHHQICSYIKDNLLKIKNDQQKRFLTECIKFYDYNNFPENLNDQIIFYNFCQADNAPFVSGLLSLIKKDFKVNEPVSNIV